MVKKYRLIFIILAVAGIGFGGYKFFTKDKGYTTYKTQTQKLMETIELSGRVDAGKRADLRFQTSGLLTYLPFKENDQVKKYQTIAALDSRQIKKTLNKYLNTYSIQRNTFEQTKDDNQDEIVNDVKDTIKRLLETNQFQLNNSILDVELQDLALQLSRIYAPFDGIITSLPVKTTNVNILYTDVFQISDPTTLYFKANIDESDVVKVAEGQKTVIELDAISDHVFDSQIRSISFASKETSTGTAFEAEFSLPEEEMKNFRLGFNGTAKIVLNEKDALALPFEALKQKGNDYYVTILENNKYIDKPVETGIETNEFVEIKSGLSEGQEVYVLNKTK